MPSKVFATCPQCKAPASVVRETTCENCKEVIFCMVDDAITVNLPGCELRLQNLNVSGRGRCILVCQKCATRVNAALPWVQP